ncbi:MULTISPECIES: alpha-hydroxy acid oxidase [unclassified Pseudofrankia]|uniref:alpha-hydroxy acid oxidase n=1 Tax=unclassified Pseudofrankia TaxID=2994372 RepID=UPI0008D93715|nr:MULTISPECIES: alpha-hydroxy acid oxidase [unclassified Pseudofrankia]MDT3440223.1 alpha-hydroxy acid oxidase [Pseudofrankia sp. BMG5.37]OHV42679.1 hypothetical protein BCD48_30395 [Pseudofrankia sp. BMG5.36]
MRRLDSVEDGHRRARRRLPNSVYWFIEGGTEEELTLRENRRAFQEVTFRPRAATAYTNHDLTTTVLGTQLSMPVIVSPAGYIRLAHRGGELAAARAAASAGTAIGVSTLSSYPIAEIAAAGARATWYQLYFAGGRPGAQIAIDAARKAGCTALILTVDLAGTAGRDRRRRANAPIRVDLRSALTYAPEMVLRPRWLAGFLRDGLGLNVPNVRLTHDGPPLSVAEASASMRRHPPTWDDVSWIRERWDGPIIIKGVLSGDDARRAVDTGAAAVVVSNHGGNALDGTPATLRVLPEVVAAVGNDAEVLLDSGVRRGADVVKALALGASAVLVGRAYIWGLAAGGEEGARQVLEILRHGISTTLSLLGCPSLADLDDTYLRRPTGQGGER